MGFDETIVFIYIYTHNLFLYIYKMQPTLNYMLPFRNGDLEDKIGGIEGMYLGKLSVSIRC